MRAHFQEMQTAQATTTTTTTITTAATIIILRTEQRVESTPLSDIYSVYDNRLQAL